jgi:hypothetical protein
MRPKFYTDRYVSELYVGLQLQMHTCDSNAELRSTSRANFNFRASRKTLRFFKYTSIRWVKLFHIVYVDLSIIFSFNVTFLDVFINLCFLMRP